MALLEVKNIYKSFGGVKAIQDFSLAADAGQIHGIIGPNGAGKTTIFNVISGVYPADQGSVTLNGQDITKIEQYKITRLGMGRTFQNIRLFKGLTVEENVMCAFDPQSRYSILGGLVPTPRRRAEEKRGRDYLLRQLQKLATPETLLEYMKYEPHEPGDILLLTGVGKIYPFLRSHMMLDSMQRYFEDIPIVMFYPGSFNGQDLGLFGRFLDGHYYRAFNLL